MRATKSVKHRIRAAAIIVDGDSILLVKEETNHPQDGRFWWIPPGGGVEGDESLEECARRETLEETGLSVDLGNIAYIRQFLEPGYHHCEIFFLATSFSGSVVTGTNPEFWDTRYSALHQGCADSCTAAK